MNLYAIIMAGGVGSRFWPRSTKKTPKQFIQMIGDRTLIQDTVKRLDGLVKDENIYIVTNSLQLDELKKQLNKIPFENLIEEPFGRNTAACIGLASVIISKKDKDAVTVILPSDHIIHDITEFHKSILCAANFANTSNGLVTIGINPTKPETGFGYIQIDDRAVQDNIFRVYTFAEKPNYATAIRFIESGDFLWNSGIFIWRTDSIINEIKSLMPDLYEGLEKIEKVLGKTDYPELLNNVYGQLRKVSIDYGIMEKSKRVYLTKGNFRWSDIGSWEEVYNLSEKDNDGNVIQGLVYTDMVIDSFIHSEDKFTAVIGVDNLVIVSSNDAVLVCRKDKSQEVKRIVDYLKINKLDQFR
ncbi:MAG TPA: mannose-1-phosphate guanylyltransferase [Ignavibacteriaceae bacterium]|nr:mannose-1-phosphate guanylyltransferase [Ignavibacteriaceae bacterium]